MKHSTLLLLFCSILLHSIVNAQSSKTNLNTLIQPATSIASNESEQVQLKNLDNINTYGIEYSPVFYKDGIIFSSDRSIKTSWLRRILSNNNSNLFYAQINEAGEIAEPIPFSDEINTKRHEGSASFNNKDRIMAYSKNCNKASANGYYELKISTAIYQNGVWNEGKDFPFNDGYRTCHPAFTKNGESMIFASNRPGGLGGMDLYASTFENGEWTTPYNLGPAINSSGDEVFPFVDVEGNLYFSSNGRPGMGGLDIFKSKQNQSCDWDLAIRFPAPFNSRWDDFSLVTDSSLEKGFLSSNRPGGKGLDDIYSWKIDTPIELPEEIMPDEEVLTQFSLRDENTGLALQNSEITLIKINPKLLETGFLEQPITIVNELSQDVLALLGEIISPAVNPEPFTSYPITPQEHYLILASKPGTEPYQQIVTSEQLLAHSTYALVFPSDKQNDIAVSENKSNILPIHPQEDELNIQEVVVGAFALLENEQTIEHKNEAEVMFDLPPTEEVFTAREIPAHFLKPNPVPLELVDIPLANKVISFSPIYHDFNKHEVLANEELLIDNIAFEMNNNQKLHLTIKSFTDSRGCDSYNLELSQKRAETVKTKLIEKGIAETRLSALGIGEAFPIVDCATQPCSEEEHQMNRRTEFVTKRQH